LSGVVSQNESLYEGAEFAVSYQPSRAAAIGANYSHTHVTTIPGGARTVGQPLSTLNLWGQYQLAHGLGAKAAFWLTSEWNVSEPMVWGGFVFGERVRVPAQYNLDLGLFYTRKGWRVDVDILNVTDERNWGPAGSIGGNSYSYLLAAERFGLQARITRSF
jgi:outer membrane receptor protein involved in Fe transport